MLFWPLIVLTGLLIAFFLWDMPLDPAAMDHGEQIRAISLAALATLGVMAVGGRLLLRSSGAALSSFLMWGCVAGGLATAFVYRDEIRPIVDGIKGRLMPSVALSRAEGEALLHRGWDGQFHADAEVNGVRLQMMVDTGATMVTLPYEEAARVGVALDRLAYTIPVVTASGRSTVAPVHLSSIRIGKVVVFDVEAAVAAPGELGTALLGMTFLGRLTEASFRRDILILRN